jgi:hypothetical protein
MKAPALKNALFERDRRIEKKKPLGGQGFCGNSGR